MSLFSDRRDQREHVEEISRQLDRAAAEAKARQPRVNALAAWFENRKMTNGLGTDFMYTFKARPTRGS